MEEPRRIGSEYCLDSLIVYAEGEPIIFCSSEVLDGIKRAKGGGIGNANTLFCDVEGCSRREDVSVVNQGGIDEHFSFGDTSGLLRVRDPGYCVDPDRPL